MQLQHHFLITLHPKLKHLLISVCKQQQSYSFTFVSNCCTLVVSVFVNSCSYEPCDTSIRQITRHNFRHHVSLRLHLVVVASASVDVASPKVIAAPPAFIAYFAPNAVVSVAPAAPLLQKKHLLLSRPLLEDDKQLYCIT